jgi:protease PrsW
LQLLDLLILLLAAFVPSVIYLVWIRNTERFNREPYRRLISVFAIGATVSVGLAIFAEYFLMRLLDQNIERVYQVLGNNPNLGSLILACVIAPLVEEFAKALGVFRVRRFITEIEDGIVYGAAAGLGFAATENLLYEGSALSTYGVNVFIASVVVRSLSSALLHASASSIFGLGIARSSLQGKGWMLYYLGAVLMHSIFNLFASFGELYQGQLGESANLIGLTAAFVLAISGISIARSKIRHLDRAQRG